MRNGSFSFDVRGLTAPFMLKIDWKEGHITRTLFSMAAGPDTANINSFSNVAVAGAVKEADPAILFASQDPVMLRQTVADFPAVIDSLMAMLWPLFQQYRTAQNPVTDSFGADHAGLDALFDNVEIVLSRGNIVMFNKATKSRIFSAPLSDIPSGNFIEANMPEGDLFGTKM